MRNYQTQVVPHIDKDIIEDIEGDAERGELLEEEEEEDEWAADTKWSKMGWKTKIASVGLTVVILLLMAAIAMMLLFPKSNPLADAKQAIAEKTASLA